MKFNVPTKVEPKSEKIDPKAIRQSYLEKMEASLEKKGAIFFDERRLNIAEDFLTLPAEITDVPSKDLGEYLNAFTQQKVYMRTLLGYAELFCEEARRKYQDASELRYRELLGSKLSETAKEREVNSDPDVKPCYEEYMDYKNKVRLLNFNISSIEDIIFLISREVSRRTGDFNEESRNYNVQRR